MPKVFGKGLSKIKKVSCPRESETKHLCAAAHPLTLSHLTMPTRAKQYSPEVLAEAQRMANSTMTGLVYEYKLVEADEDDKMLGITYVGQNGEPSMAPDAALVDRDKKHAREAISHPNKPFSRAISSYGKAAFDGPRVIAKAKGKRLNVMMWLDENEDKEIVARGGPWRDGSYGAAQTLNAKRGGQGDPFTRLCGLAERKLKGGPRVTPPCEHPGGCKKQARHGGLPFCKAHGGGVLCSAPGCQKAAQGAYKHTAPFCRLHGGGTRCQHEGCDKITHVGEFCIAHGAVQLQCAHAGCIRPSKFGGMCFLHADGDWKAGFAKRKRISYAKKRTEALVAQAELAVAKFGTQCEG